MSQHSNLSTRGEGPRTCPALVRGLIGMLRLSDSKLVTFRRSTEKLRERSKLRRPSPRLRFLRNSWRSIPSLWSLG